MIEDRKTREEAAVIRALEHRPEIAIPEGFAARVARSAPPRATVRSAARPVFGRAAGYLAVATITLVLVLLTQAQPEALEAGRGFVFAVELLLVAQLLAVGLWLGTQRDDLG